MTDAFATLANGALLALFTVELRKDFVLALGPQPRPQTG